VAGAPLPGYANRGVISIGHLFGMTGSRTIAHALIEGRARRRIPHRDNVHWRRHGQRCLVLSVLGAFIVRFGCILKTDILSVIACA
jgi:acetyl-CoA acetyltransferase